jgi:hypothetical protein
LLPLPGQGLFFFWGHQCHRLLFAGDYWLGFNFFRNSNGVMDTSLSTNPRQ